MSTTVIHLLTQARFKLKTALLIHFQRNPLQSSCGCPAAAVFADDHHRLFWLMELNPAQLFGRHSLGDAH